MRSWTVFVVLAWHSLQIMAQETRCFDDVQLRMLQTAPSQRGLDRGHLLYVWSPRMSLSVTQAHEAARAAALEGLAFVPVHDARVAAHEMDGVMRLARQRLPDSVIVLLKSQPLCAPSLIERDALRHFPTAFVLTARDGLHRFPIVGAMPEAAWRQSLAQRLGQP
jgi:hypothetical protein